MASKKKIITEGHASGDSVLIERKGKTGIKVTWTCGAQYEFTHTRIDEALTNLRKTGPRIGVLLEGHLVSKNWQGGTDRCPTSVVLQLFGKNLTINEGYIAATERGAEYTLDLADLKKLLRKFKAAK